MTPRRILHHSPSSSNNHTQTTKDTQQQEVVHLATPTEEMMEDTTPKNNITRLVNNCNTNNHPSKTTNHHQHQSAVKFGNNTAAEFDFSQPITEMTPIPPSVVQQIFPSEMKEELEEMGVSRETARNVALLAEWDDDFDCIIGEGGGNDEGGGNGNGGGGSVPQKRGRKHTPYKLTGGRRRSSSTAGANRRPRKARRESSLFSRDRKSLIDPEDDNNMDNMDDSNGGGGGGGTTNGNRNGIDNHDDDDQHRLPFSVTIDPEEYTSPSSTSVVSSESISTLGTPAALGEKKTDDNVRTSLDTAASSSSSACISPSSSSSNLNPKNNNNSNVMNNTSLDGSVDGITGRRDDDDRHGGSRESNGSSRGSGSSTVTGRATPNSARTSSSTILRAVHASGALLPSHSPSQQGGCGGGGVAAASSSSGGVGGGNGSGGGGLQPNQLKYSPSSSSSGCSSSSTSTVRMDISPSSDTSSLGSDIMSLFTHHGLDDDGAVSTTDDNISSRNSLFLLKKQLEIFSAHPMQLFHTSITDLVRWTGSSSRDSSTQQQKTKEEEEEDPLSFMKEELLRGLSPQACLSLIADESTSTNDDGNSVNESMMYGGNSKWLQSALFIRRNDCNNGGGTANSSSIFTQKSLESILLDEIKEMASSPNNKKDRSNATAMIDSDLQTIASCFRRYYDVACMDWSSMEVDAAMRTLSRLQAVAKTTKREMADCNEFVATCCKKLMEVSSLTMQQLAAKSDDTAILSPANKRLKMRKRKVQSQLEYEMSNIQSLEDQLANEVNRLNQTKRAKRLFDAHLEMERVSPISALSDGIRTIISPAPVYRPDTGNATDLAIYLLGGSAEIIVKIDEDEDIATTSTSNKPMMELGCFIRDGGAAIKLLQGFLLGNIGRNLEESLGPFPLRESLSTRILECKDRGEAFLELSHLFSRIDALVRSVRELETNGICTVNDSADGDVVLSISMSHECTVVRIGFSFRQLVGKDWHVTTTPSHVKVSIVSTERDLSLLENQLQEQAHHLLIGSRSSDPILLRRICGKVMNSFAKAASLLNVAANKK
ncbi:hypothetical protein ACHAXR_009763 [Thalassiosira sp. AJA248-18]